MINRLLAMPKNDMKISIGGWAAFLYFASMPLMILHTSFGGSLLKYVAILVVIILCFEILTKKVVFKFNMLHLSLIIYLMYSFSTLFHYYTSASVVGVRGIFETIMLLLLITIKKYNEKEIKLIEFSWILIGIVTVLLIMIGGSKFEGRVIISFAGSTEDPNQLCGYFIFPLVVLFKRIQQDKKDIIISIILVLFMLYSVILTGSRGGLIAIIATIFVYLMFGTRGSISKKIQFLLIASLLTTIISISIWPKVPESVKERFSVEDVVETGGSGRTDIWLSIIDGLKGNENAIIFGYGIESAAVYLYKHVNAIAAHNHWLQILFDQGIIGVILFLLAYFIAMYRGLKYNRIVFVALCGMFVLSMSLTLYPAYYKGFWNVLMMAAINYNKNT